MAAVGERAADRSLIIAPFIAFVNTVKALFHSDLHLL